MIVLSCKMCSAKLKIKDDFAGKQGRCPFCRAVMVIPFPMRDPSDSEVGSATEMITASILEQARADLNTTPPPSIRFQCPRCAELVNASPMYIGRQVVCPHCRKKITVPPR